MYKCISPTRFPYGRKEEWSVYRWHSNRDQSRVLPVSGKHCSQYKRELIFPLSLKFLSLQALVLYIAVCGIATHAVFKHYEPSSVVIHGALLIIFPLVLSALLTSHLHLSNAIITAFSTFHGTLCSSILLYRLSPLHSLYQFPGPVFCKISKVSFAWISSHGTQHVYVRQLHDKYGDIVRIGPNEISIRDVSLINAVMGTQGLPKGPSLAGRTFQSKFTSLIGLRDPHAHFIRRKPWNRALNMSAIKEFQPILTARAAQLVESVGQQQDIFDLSRWFGFFTYDFMCDMVFGGGSEMLREGDPQQHWDRMQKAIDALMWLDHLPWLADYARKFPRSVATISNGRMSGIKRIERRKNEGVSRKDLMYSLSNEDIGGDTPPHEIVLLEGFLAIVAGSDTTSGVLSNVFYYLLSNPEVYKRLQSEVDRYYPTSEDSLDPQYYPQMPYLDAVINETLRLMPAVPSGSQRAPLIGSGGKLVGP
ncbi:hypothetical protein NM688_g9401 [Phlebia brevispora]|uniref:Uncharacterized protein n=1 Tax=Phlebia brevispora TaxID=194682 RepID=A0ACC1RHY2_9APHY|nr:hypothetical protein NM688_g9401 [Phlebia brevispora]